VDELPQKTVRFRVGDVVHPRPVQVLLELFRHLNLEGEVVAATTDGETQYVVVRVAGLADVVIVPTDRTSLFSQEDEPAAVTGVAARQRETTRRVDRAERGL
jgi:hypothetical protein